MESTKNWLTSLSRLFINLSFLDHQELYVTSYFCMGEHMEGFNEERLYKTLNYDGRFCRAYKKLDLEWKKISEVGLKFIPD